MILLSQLVGQRVLARDSGELLGSLRRLLVDPARPAVAAAYVESPGGGPGRMVDWSAVAGIGPDAVMVSGPDALREPDGGRDWQLLEGRLDVTGKLVMDERGDALGTLEDIEFDEASGRLARLFVPGHAVEVERIVTLGPDVLIVPAPEPAAAGSA